jgi:membrane protease YdiL (CAAX protease family)
MHTVSQRTSEGGRRVSADAIFLVLWLSADAALLIGGDRFDGLQGLIVGSILLALMWLTRGFTPPPQALPLPRNAFLGTIVVVAIVVLTGLDAVVRGPSGLLGAWNALHWGITDRLVPIVRVLDDESVDNTVRYVLVPLGLLLVLGWRAGSFGCGPSRRGTARAALLWSALPFVGYGIGAAIIGHGKPVQLAHRYFIDVFRNGYAEEILFRGMLLGVVVPRLGLATGNVVQALAFGLWHLGADLRDTHANVWLALADGVATQAMAGYAYGKLTLRTGNVLAAGASHAIYDGGTIFS